MSEVNNHFSGLINRLYTIKEIVRELEDKLIKSIQTCKEKKKMKSKRKIAHEICKGEVKQFNMLLELQNEKRESAG